MSSAEEIFKVLVDKCLNEKSDMLEKLKLNHVKLSQVKDGDIDQGKAIADELRAIQELGVTLSLIRKTITLPDKIDKLIKETLFVIAIRREELIDTLITRILI
jgi:hypothetical protein